MTRDVTIPKSLKDRQTFSRTEYGQIMLREYGLNEQQSKYSLQKYLEQGEIVHFRWNQYATVKTKKVYSHAYLPAVMEVVKTIEDNYTMVNFQVFELIQLNQFVNHLMAHNTIFVGVENDLIDFVFDTLNRAYPGRVMLKPSLEMYYRYLQDDEIVIGRLPSETPRGLDQPWQARLEKILVDIMVDKLIGRIVPESEKAAIINEAYHDYLIDEGTMIRYAKRRGAVNRLADCLREYGRTMQL